MSEPKSALVAGVGPGLGAALVVKFVAEGFRVAAVARNRQRLEALLAERGLQEGTKAYACDVTEPGAVSALFAKHEAELGTPSIVVFNAGAYTLGSVQELTPEEVIRCWRVGCFGGFLIGQAAVRSMLGSGGGSLLFTGATAGLRGSAGFAALAIAKFGLRALAQSMAREYGPKGIHVAHVVIDGGIGEAIGRQSEKQESSDSSLLPDAIAETYWQLHLQQRSGWTQELDLRPWVESF